MLQKQNLVIDEARLNGSNFSDSLLNDFNNRIALLNARETTILDLNYSFKDKLLEIVNELNKVKNRYYNEISISELKNKVTKNISVYRRSIVLKEIVKKEAKGVCQLCKEFAPFLDKYGNPFLEVHHIEFLSQGGKDELDNMVALCPNCHRKVHHLPDLNEKNELIKIANRKNETI